MTTTSFIKFIVLTSFLLQHVVSQSYCVSVKYELTYHIQPATWSTASSVCRANNGRLAKLDTKLKRNVVDHFKNFAWLDMKDLDYWIGLFDSKAPHQQFTWTDGSSLDPLSTFWLKEEPDYPEVQQCVRETYAEQAWRTKECNHKYPFICEKEIGICTFSSSEDKVPFFTGQQAVTFHAESNLNLPECQAKCEGSSYNDTLCWAVMLSPLGNCTLYFDSGPVSIWCTGTIPTSGYIFSQRTCFLANHNKNGIPLSSVDEAPVPSAVYHDPLKPLKPSSGRDILATLLSVNTETRLSATDHLCTEQTNEISTFSTVLTLDGSDVETAGAHVTFTESMTKNDLSLVISSQATLTTGLQPTHPVRFFDSDKFKNEYTYSIISPNRGADDASTVSSTDPLFPLPHPDVLITEVDNTHVPSTANPIRRHSAKSHFARQTSLTGQVPSGSTSDVYTDANKCRCSCNWPESLTKRISPNSVEVSMEGLSFDKHQVSAWKRKFSSAPDHRPSVQVIGYSGLLIILLLSVTVVILDLGKIVNRSKIIFLKH